jgi:ribosomal protein S18 acetylase RimI-like enzyme
LASHHGISNLVVRRGSASDDAICGQIIGAAGASSVYLSRLPWAKIKITDTAALPIAHRSRLIAELDGIPVGFCDFEPAGWRSPVPGDWYVKNLFVHPEEQSKGVGQALLDAVWQEAPGGLALSVHAVNDAASIFYLRQGFEIFGGTLEDDWHGGPVVWLHLRKKRHA